MEKPDYPRVTEILKPFTNLEYVPREVLDRAATRGTKVHALCAGIAEGAWIPDASIDPEHVGYVQSFVKWHLAQVKEFMVIEKRFADEHLYYTGQVDFVVMGTDDQIWLVDIKTSTKHQKTYPVQMAAYRELLALHGIKTHGAMLVFLDKDGEFPDIDVLENTEGEFSVFLAALECHKFFKQRKKNNGRTSTE